MLPSGSAYSVRSSSAILPVLFSAKFESKCQEYYLSNENLAKNINTLSHTTKLP